MSLTVVDVYTHTLQPHPDAVIPPVMAKWYGARLSRVYGWTMSTFEVKAGADKEDTAE